MREAMMDKPAFSKRRYTSPMRLRLTPSGLTMDRVRSSAMRKILTKLGEESQPTRLQTSRAVYLGISVRSNLSGAASVPRKCRFHKDFWRGSQLGRPNPGRTPAAVEAGAHRRGG